MTDSNQETVKLYTFVPSRSPVPYESIADVEGNWTTLYVKPEMADEMIRLKPHIYSLQPR